MEGKWRCEKCGALLGVEHGRHMCLRYKQAQYVVKGGDCSIIAVCRKCSTVNEWNGCTDQPRLVPVRQ